MEQSNLIYDSSIKAVICIEHGYCLPVSSIRTHLNRLHGVKGAPLKAACEEIQVLDIEDLSQLQQPFGKLPIPYLPIETGW